MVKILTGVRRCGKSTILLMVMEALKARGIAEQNILHYNFDSMQYDAIADAKSLYKEVQAKHNPKGKTYLFLDEVQEVKNWEKAVNSFMNDFDVDIYVTGSNSRMMSSEISTYLTGRYVSFRVFPLSFAEYLQFKAAYAPVETPHAELANYLMMGGFPALHLRPYTQSEAYTIVRDIYNSTIFTDIVERNQIRKIDQLERIVKFVFNNVGKTFSANSISQYLKSQHRNIDIETVYDICPNWRALISSIAAPATTCRGKKY